MIYGKKRVSNDHEETNFIVIDLFMMQEADLGIADLTITAERESAVEFTVPFLNLGN